MSLWLEKIENDSVSKRLAQQGAAEPRWMLQLKNQKQKKLQRDIN